ncbi:MAG: twin-arginine translocase subunit TatC, partial [Candidatus Cloacimonetes bacterium]|nr:twin-arginine translocase subunit TatC [Candidatus Cloacimonadota bacterium]
MEQETSGMSILSHVNELRKRLLISVIALAVATVIGFVFSRQLAEVLAGPIGGLSAMKSIDVTENVTAFMKISLLAGVVLALPIVVYEIFAFVLPGLKPNERKWVWFMIPLATLFFAAGLVFAYFVLLPTALPFLLNFMGIATAPRPSTYFGFVLNLLFWVGLAFELPLIVFLLARIGLITAKQLARQWRIAIVVIAILAAFITPTP